MSSFPVKASQDIIYTHLRKENPYISSKICYSRVAQVHHLVIMKTEHDFYGNDPRIVQRSHVYTHHKSPTA